MDDNKVKRINELYHKSKTAGLSHAEKAEQAALRKEYIESFHNNLRGQLDRVRVKNPDGSITKLKKKTYEN